MLFWSWIWYGKLIFLKIIFEQNFFYLKNVIWIYILYIQLNSASTTTQWTTLNWSCSGAGVVASQLHSWRLHVLSRSLNFCNSFLDWKLFSFVLRAAIAYRYCTIKSHNGKSRCRQYKIQMSLQYEFVTSHWHLLRLRSRLHPWLSGLPLQKF